MTCCFDEKLNKFFKFCLHQKEFGGQQNVCIMLQIPGDPLLAQMHLQRRMYKLSELRKAKKRLLFAYFSAQKDRKYPVNFSYTIEVT